MKLSSLPHYEIILRSALSLAADGSVMGWLPIETAPRDGSSIVCWREGWEGPIFLCWKMNSRIREEYFGDPVEYDDYELAEADKGPTHWHPLEDLPSFQPSQGHEKSNGRSS